MCSFDRKYQWFRLFSIWIIFTNNDSEFVLRLSGFSQYKMSTVYILLGVQYSYDCLPKRVKSKHVTKFNFEVDNAIIGEF